jgi:hypothetical protein
MNSAFVKHLSAPVQKSVSINCSLIIFSLIALAAITVLHSSQFFTVLAEEQEYSIKTTGKNRELAIGIATDFIYPDCSSEIILYP